MSVEETETKKRLIQSKKTTTHYTIEGAALRIMNDTTEIKLKL